MAVKGLGRVEGHAFLSYVREDSTMVDQFEQALHIAGIPVWRDTSDLWPGEDWREKIREAITDNALVFIACFSTNSLARVKSYHNAELALAVEELRLRRPEQPWLIPVRFDDCEIPDRDIGGGRRLSSLQWVDVFGSSFDTGIERLVAVIRRILGPPSATEMQARDEERQEAGDATLATLIRNRLLFVPRMRSLYIVDPESEPTQMISKLARRHRLEPGEELIAIWRLGSRMPWGSSDSLAFTTSRISIADAARDLSIPYLRFGELEFKERHKTTVGSPNAQSDAWWITIEGPELNWKSPGFGVLSPDPGPIVIFLNEIKKLSINQRRKDRG